MEILLVAATELETAPLREKLGLVPGSGKCFQGAVGRQHIQLLHTGIGMVGTAYCLGRHLAQHRPDLVVNVGIAGSFNSNLLLGQVVEVVEDSFPELGAEQGDEVIDLKVMGFPQFVQDGKPFYNTFSNPRPSRFSLPKVTGLTVNTVHGREDSIKRIHKRWEKDIETMEGAAFFHVMLREKIPFYAFRSISNYVAPRDKNAWKLDLATESLGDFLQKALASDVRDSPYF